MKGMILAGGLSTRLYPLTLELPKPLVPVLDRPVVGHVIEYVKAHGIDDLVINVHYFPQAVRGYADDGSKWGVRIEYLHETQLMGSAGAVRQVADRFAGTFVVIGCDDVTDIDLAAAVDFHRERKAEATIVLVEVADVSQYGAVIVDDSGRILEFQEKPAKGTERSNLANTGVYIFEPALLRRIPPKTFYDFGKQVFPDMLAAGGAFYGMRQQSYWCDIGTPSEYRRVHRDALQGRIKLHLREGATLSDSVLLGPGASVAPSARVEGPTCIGAGSTVDDGAHVSSSILWNDVKVGADARVEDVVFADRVVVEKGASVKGGEYGKSTRIPAKSATA
ncbi:MAG: NDP-sugar synthase [Candidatus Eremiobacteraeota bacterium]|nr:NDP-sugar synthase [Candidatus Eremiobacteraeota bacterium]